jgi:hypothetical protein
MGIMKWSVITGESTISLDSFNLLGGKKWEEAEK